jgi:CTP:molybdopterin cytidylyltransferase MocA
MQHITTVIFCGGNSERMNFPKMFLKLNGHTLLEETVGSYKNSGIENICVIINEKLLYHPLSSTIKQISGQCKILVNKYPGKGRTYSVSIAAKFAGNCNCFLQNIDNPVPDKNIIKKMIQLLTDDASYVVPQIGESTGHPVLAGKAVMKHLSEKKGLNWNLRDELKTFRKTILHLDDENLLLNFNTPQEWNNYLSRYGK